MISSAKNGAKTSSSTWFTPTRNSRPRRKSSSRISASRPERVRQAVPCVARSADMAKEAAQFRRVAQRAEGAGCRGGAKAIPTRCHQLRDPAVLALYPQYVDDANAYEFIAEADHAAGDTKSEAAILTAYEQQAAKRPMLLKRLAATRSGRGRTERDASATLERDQLHLSGQRRGVAPPARRSALRPEEVRRRHPRVQRAWSRSNPVDKAGAQFNLAQAYFAAGQKDKAQDSVLAALEAAPDYRPAQKLLLELQRSSAKSN